MKQISILLFLSLLLISCKKDTSPGTPGDDTKKGVPISFAFDLSESATDAASIMSKSSSVTASTTTTGEPEIVTENLRFRLMYEIKPEAIDTVIRGFELHEITSSGITIKDTLEYGNYSLAVWGNYVLIDDKGEIIEEQYQADPVLGLQKVTILNPEKEKKWGFAYSGSIKFTVAQSTKNIKIPILRCVMQIQFKRHYSGDNNNQWDNAVASNIKLTDFSTCYDVYKDKASIDSENPVIQLTEIDNRESYYYRMTLFESLQDCYIDLQYINNDGSTINLPQFHNNRVLYRDGYKSWKSKFNRNRLVYFGSLWTAWKAIPEEPFTTIMCAALMGDETIFEATVFSSVEPSDSLVLVDFFIAMNGDKWVQPWRLNLPVSTWAGIELSPLVEGQKQRVVRMKMTSEDGGENTANLQGYIPASLGNLSELIELRIIAELEYIEDFLPNLSKLEILYVVNDYGILGGVNPTLILSNQQTHLKGVMLQSISIKNFNTLWQNPELKRVKISHVELLSDTTIMETTGNLSKLTCVKFLSVSGVKALSDNIYNIGTQVDTLAVFNGAESPQVDLGRIIDSYPKMKRVQLELDNQQIPTKIEQWTKLEFLNFAGDMYGTLPLELIKLPLLRVINIQNAPRLTGTIPKELIEGKIVNLNNTGIKIE